jgi:hypothetical protein
MCLSKTINAVLLSTFYKSVFSVVLLLKEWSQKKVYKNSKEVV